MATSYGPQMLMTTVAEEMRQFALSGIFDGTDVCFEYLARCEAVHAHYSGIGSRLMFARDDGYCDAGIFARPELNRAYRLSLSFFHSINGQDGYFNFPHMLDWMQAFFRHHVSRAWIEPPSRHHTTRSPDMWHIRVFADEQWNPIAITGEAAADLMGLRWFDYKTFLNSAPTPERVKTELRLVKT